jgi:hypothetical protein
VVRALLINPLLIAVLAGLVFCASEAGAIHIHLQAAMLAAGVCLIAAEIALIPLVVMRHSSQANVSQAGLMSTVLHMLLSGVLGLTISAWLNPGTSFMYWLVIFYWLTLLCIAIAAVRAVKSAPMRLDGAGRAAV